PGRAEFKLGCGETLAGAMVGVYRSGRRSGRRRSGVGRNGDIAATLTVGPTSEGMVRLLVEGEGVELPMDFDPEDAEEIADELRAAALRARQTRAQKAAPPDRRRRR